MLTLYPLLPLDGRRKIAVLGLFGQMSGAAAVIGIDVEAGRATVTVSTKMKALGSFGLFVTKQEDSENTLMVTATLCDKRIPDAYQHVKDLKNGFLLKLDLEGAWKELALSDQHIVVKAAI